jgi:GntR family transcriptional repressor for pyruvate dehydrogenase complex
MPSKAKTLDPVTKSRLHEDIVSQIQKKILTGKFPAGDKLPSERELATTFNVNRATVREALKKLELLGLIEILHGDGIYVNDYLKSGNLELFKAIVYMDEIISIEVLRNILDIRKILVPEMAFCAAKNRGANDLRDLKEIVYSDVQAGSIPERDLAVHHSIARASKNLLYIFMLNFFNQIFRDFGYLYFDDPRNVKRTKKFHRDIYEAIDKGEAPNARRIMREVLMYVEEKIFNYYKKTYSGRD